MFLRYDMSDKKTRNFNLMLIGIFVLYGGIFFYLVQTKELRRFFDNQVTIKKEQQVSNVLDSQSDGIVVVQLNTKNSGKSN